jgi:hypothetical protein
MIKPHLASPRHETPSSMLSPIQAPFMAQPPRHPATAKMSTASKIASATVNPMIRESRTRLPIRVLDPRSGVLISTTFNTRRAVGSEQGESVSLGGAAANSTEKHALLGGDREVRAQLRGIMASWWGSAEVPGTRNFSEIEVLNGVGGAAGESDRMVRGPLAALFRATVGFETWLSAHCLAGDSAAVKAGWLMRCCDAECHLLRHSSLRPAP